jgi:alcohol dehydrogenase (cytochrome c)
MNSRLIASLLASTVIGVGLTVPATAADVTPQRLRDAASEPHNWLMPYGSYNSHNHSALAQINRGNVANLKIKFTQSLGGTDWGSNKQPPNQQGTPLVDDGFLYIPTGWSEVLKIDVRNGNRGQIMWTNDPKTDRTVTSRARGLALLGKNVYHTPADGRLVAIDRDSGQTVFEVSTKAAEAPDNQRHSGAPLAVKNMIVAGQSNGSNGNRAWLAGFNASDGKPAWRFWVIPGPGEPGHETWKDDHNAYATGGGAIWTTPSYDPDQNLIIFGTGDPAPWGDPVFRPGDNLYAVSTVALDADTGKLRWYFQETPNESWDFDTVNPKILYDVSIGGETRKISGNFSRNGFYYSLDRANGQFVNAKAFLQVNWTKGLDPKTGKPLEYNPQVALQEYPLANRPGKENLVCPNYYGAPTLMPPTYDAGRMVAYIGTSAGCFNNQLTETKDPKTDWRGQNMGANWVRTSAGEQLGQVIGVDVRTGNTVKKSVTPFAVYSGVLSTAGDLIFTAYADGKVAALDSDTLAELWSFHTGTPISAPPITYAVDGRQFVAIQIGGQDLSAPYNRPELKVLKTNSMLMVFGL